MLGQVSVDTIKASVVLDAPLDVNAFDRRHETTSRGKSYVKFTTGTKDEETIPRVTYYPNEQRLLCEVSLPKFFRGDNVKPLSASEVGEALDRLTVWLRERFGRVPDIRKWSTRRVDYAANWTVGNLLDTYLESLGNLSLARYERRRYSSGVRWQSGSRHVTLYDKFKESGNPQAKGVLRFEVQNKASAINYMSKQWFGDCGVTIDVMTSPGVSHHVVAYFFDKLGVVDASQVEAKIVKMIELFPHSWAQANTYRDLIEKQGVDAYKTGPMSSTTYYRYKRKLSDAGLLGGNRDNTKLEALRLALPKNLKVQNLPPYHGVNQLQQKFSKIFREVV